MVNTTQQFDTSANAESTCMSDVIFCWDDLSDCKSPNQTESPQYNFWEDETEECTTDVQNETQQYYFWEDETEECTTDVQILAELSKRNNDIRYFAACSRHFPNLNDELMKNSLEEEDDSCYQMMNSEPFTLYICKFYSANYLNEIVDCLWYNDVLNDYEMPSLSRRDILMNTLRLMESLHDVPYIAASEVGWADNYAGDNWEAEDINRNLIDCLPAQRDNLSPCAVYQPYNGPRIMEVKISHGRRYYTAQLLADRCRNVRRPRVCIGPRYMQDGWAVKPSCTMTAAAVYASAVRCTKMDDVNELTEEVDYELNENEVRTVVYTECGARQVFHMIIRGVKALQSKGFVHRNVCPTKVSITYVPEEWLITRLLELSFPHMDGSDSDTVDRTFHDDNNKQQDDWNVFIGSATPPSTGRNIYTKSPFPINSSSTPRPPTVYDESTLTPKANAPTLMMTSPDNHKAISVSPVRRFSSDIKVETGDVGFGVGDRISGYDNEVLSNCLSSHLDHLNIPREINWCDVECMWSVTTTKSRHCAVISKSIEVRLCDGIMATICGLGSVIPAIQKDETQNLFHREYVRPAQERKTFCPPEVLMERSIAVKQQDCGVEQEKRGVLINSEKYHVYCLGATLFCMLYGYAPPDENSSDGSSLCLPATPLLSEELNSFLHSALHTNPEARITLTDMIEHPWLTTNFM